MSNKYLEKLAVTRLVKELAKGNVRKSLTSLVNKGALRSQKTYIAGMERGNTNISKQIKVPIRISDNPIIAQGVGVTQLGKKSPIVFMPKSQDHLKVKFGGNTKHVTSGIVRHELFESMDAKQSLRNGYKGLPMTEDTRMKGLLELFDNKTKRTLSQLKVPPQSSQIKIPAERAKQLVGKFFTGKESHFLNHVTDAEVGNHMTPRVLARESEMVRKNPYLNKTFKNTRRHTGEAGLVQRLTGKRYGTDQITSKDLKKAYHAKPDGTDAATGNKVYYVNGSLKGMTGIINKVK